MNEKRMLLVFAHPDDESFGMGATIARYVKEGAQVDLICATNGEAGTVPPEFLEGFDSIKALRIHELECASQALGLHEVYRFDYRDSGMPGSPDNAHPDALAQEDLDVLIGKVVKVIREVRPQVVVTFDPYGGYGHPDHIAVHKATVGAFGVCGKAGAYPEHGLAPYQPQRLYHTNFGRFTRFSLQLAIWVARLAGKDPRRMGTNEDIDMVAAAENHHHPIHVLVDVRAYARLGEQASDCHASQLGGLSGALPLWLRRLLFGAQAFTQIWPIRANGRAARDLFDGVETQR